MICLEVMIDSYKFRIGNLEDEEWKKFVKVLVFLLNVLIYIDDMFVIIVSEMRVKCRRFKFKEKGFGFVMVDYLQFMIVCGRFESK